MEHSLVRERVHSEREVKQETRNPAAGQAAYEILTNKTKPSKPTICPKIFLSERDQAFDSDQPSGFVPMDVRSDLGVDYPATTPNLLARYLIIISGEEYSHQLNSANEVYFVISGEGHTLVDGETISWQAGEIMYLPGGKVILHQALARSVLLVVTDEPLLSYLGTHVDWGSRGLSPTLFTRADIEATLDRMSDQNDEDVPGRAFVLMPINTDGTRSKRSVMAMAINTLNGHSSQRAHRHSPAALALSLEGAQVHSVVDGQRVDWSQYALMLTPPNAVHSHHNESASRMVCFVVQDAWLHEYMGTANFSFAD